MNGPVVSRSVFPRWVAVGTWGFAGWLVAGAAEPVAADGPAVRLDKLVVNAASGYRPIEEGWQVGEVPGFRIFSHGGSAQQSVAEQLQLTRAAFGLMGKHEALLKRLVTVVVTADEPEFLAWAGLPPDAMDRTTRVAASPAGTVLLVNGGHDAVHRAVGRSYVLALLRDSRLPRWLQEGIAQIANSTEAKGDHLLVGGVQQDPRNQVSLRALHEINTLLIRDGAGTEVLPASRHAEVGTLMNTRGDPIQVRIDERVPMQWELENHISDELQRRNEARFTYTPTTDFFSHLGDTKVMSLEQVLDPDAADTVAWRMNAWAFTHYGLFGDRQGNRPAFLRFVERLEHEPARVPGELFAESFKVAPGKFGLTLAGYVRSGRYSIYDFKLAEPFRPATPAMAAVPEANVLLLRARVLGTTGRSEDARQLLTRGYANPANRTPSYVTALAGLERTRDLARAAELLEQADRREQLDNPGRCLLAELRWERLRQGGAKLSLDDLRNVLRPLFVALELGDRSEGLFVLIGQAWTTSAVAPKPENLEILRVGLGYHPNSRRLTELLKQLESS